MKYFLAGDGLLVELCNGVDVVLYLRFASPRLALPCLEGALVG